MAKTVNEKKPGATPAATLPDKSNTRGAKAEHLFRFSRADADSADDEEKTIQVCFASEELVLRKARAWEEELGIAKAGTKYWELLSHRKEDVDFSELDGGKGTVLDEHENSLQLGKVPRAKLSKDKVSRGVLKFDGLSELSNTRFEQMKRGERTGISTGYWHTSFVADEGEKDGYPIKRVAWAADEISSVRCAADTNRAGVRRSAEGQWACLCCGGMFDRAKLDENYECGCETEIRAKREAVKTRKAVKPDDFKFKRTVHDAKLKRDVEDEVSFSDLRSMVSAVADSDKRFKSKRQNGDVFSAFFVDDIIYDQDEEAWKAVLFNWYDSTVWEVAFELDGETVTLGEAVEGRIVQKFEALAEDTKRSTVDSNKITKAGNTAPNILKRNFMAEEIKLTPELVIDSLETPAVKAALEAKGFVARKAVEADAKTRSDKFKARNTEITTLEAEFVKDFGNRVGRETRDGKKQPFYLRDKIHIAALEACAMDDVKPDSEVRQIFRTKVDDLKRDSSAEPNLIEAVNAPDDVANACDLFGAIRTMVKEALKRGTQSTGLKPFEGAEKEADEGIRRQLADIPGTIRITEQGGFIMPHNARSRIQRKGGAGGRLQRDFLAGDFPTGGALIAPDFMPWIDLLRNRVVLAELGATFLSGLTGPLVFPRLEASTVAQSVAEGAQLNPYDQVLGQIKMEPHRVGSRQYYSRLAILQPSCDVEALIWNDHAEVRARYIDAMGINGTGAADQPLGILNMPGINQVVFGGTPTYTQLVSFRTNIRKFNVPGPLAFATTSVGQGRLAVLPKNLIGATVVSNSSEAMWKGDELDGQLLDSKAMASQQIPGDILLAGVFANLMIGMFGGIVSTVDNFTRADRDEIAITFNNYFDTAVRHAQAFTRSADTVNQ